jgi:hypothetical protein
MGNGTWSNSAGPIFVYDGFGGALSGFMPRLPARPEGHANYAPSELGAGSQFYFTFSYQVFCGTSQTSMTLLDYQYSGQSIVLTLLGTNVASATQTLQVQYSVPGASTLKTAVVPFTLPGAIPCGPVNDQAINGPNGVSYGRYGLALNYSCGELSVTEIFGPPPAGGGGTVMTPGEGNPVSLPNFGTNLATVTGADRLAIGDLAAGGSPVDGYIGNLIIYRCPNAPGSGGQASPLKKVPDPTPEISSAGLSWVKGAVVVPNPAASKATLFVNLAQPGQVEARVLNLVGSTVLEEGLGDQVAGVSEKELDLSHLASGIYIVVVTSSDNSGTRVVGTFKLAVVH